VLNDEEAVFNQAQQQNEDAADQPIDKDVLF
jgi:hypothetical protein